MEGVSWASKCRLSQIISLESPQASCPMCPHTHWPRESATNFTLHHKAAANLMSPRKQKGKMQCVVNSPNPSNRREMLGEISCKC